MNKRSVFALFLLFLLGAPAMVSAGPGGAAGASLTGNAGFSEGGGGIAPWETVVSADRYGTVSWKKVVSAAPVGRAEGLQVDFAQPGWLSLEQSISVQPGQVYRFTLKLRLPEAGQRAATQNFAFLVEGAAQPQATITAAGPWRTVEWYGKTADDQTSLKVSLRLGSPESTASGSWFLDEASVVSADLPAGRAVLALKAPVAVAQIAVQELGKNLGDGPFFLFMPGVLAALAGLCVLFLRRYTGLKNTLAGTAGPTGLEAKQSGCIGAFIERHPRITLAVVLLLFGALSLFRLGDVDAPRTAWEPKAAGETIVLDAGSEQEIGWVAMRFAGGRGAVDVTLRLADESLPATGGGSFMVYGAAGSYSWLSRRQETIARYIVLTVVEPGFTAYELQALAGDGSPLALKPLSGAGAESLVDEPGSPVRRNSFEDNPIFDEPLYVETADAYLHGKQGVEHTHPPLGKILIAAGMALFGPTPFAWRLPGVLAGIGMLAVLYAIAMGMFASRTIALSGVILLGLDFMHFVQTRIATLDAFLVLFLLVAWWGMAEFFRLDLAGERFGRILGWLALSGAGFACAAATKWSGITGSLGLAVVFFGKLGAYGLRVRRARQDLQAIPHKHRAKSEPGRLAGQFPLKTALLLGAGMAFFVVLPLTVYVLSYLPWIKATGGGLAQLVALQTQMWGYHEGRSLLHEFASPWYGWLAISRPLLYFSDTTGAVLEPAGITWHAIVTAMGNPAIWWAAIPVAIISVLVLVRLRDKALGFVLLGFFSQFLPWIIIPRSQTFIYHFFPAVPFLILAGLRLFQLAEERLAWKSWPRWLWLGSAFLLFVLFYPILSATPVPEWWVELCKWLPTWVFFKGAMS